MTSEIAIKKELIQAACDLSSRGLLFSAKWAAELAAACRCEAETPDDSIELNLSGPNHEEPMEEKILLAKAYFDLREFQRAAQVLKHTSGLKACFLRGYSLFMDEGKNRHERQNRKLSCDKPENATDKPDDGMGELIQLREELSCMWKQGQLDTFCKYLLGIVLRELENKELAKKVLVECVNSYPCNMSAWIDLSHLCDDSDEAKNLVEKELSPHWMVDFFAGQVALLYQRNQEALEIYHTLAKRFPHSDYIRGQIAVALYNLREFDEAERQFLEFFSRDPYCLDHVDTYSNILYVKEDSAGLAYLVQKASAIDKNRAETCCAIGNYYSLRSSHEKAVSCFRKAIALCPNNLSAYTLIGHEYLELKNVSASIQAYRQALEINDKDYRAWYGLGQTYQILGQPLFSLFYFGKASSLRPYDPRMWCALGACNETLGKTQSAISCYQRAYQNDEREGIALNRLANLHRSLGHADDAAQYFRLDLARRDREQTESPETIEALTYLSQYYKAAGKLEEAEKYCSRLLDFSGRAREEAKSMLREIHNMNVLHIKQPQEKTLLRDADLCE